MKDKTIKIEKIEVSHTLGARVFRIPCVSQCQLSKLKTLVFALFYVFHTVALSDDHNSCFSHVETRPHDLGVTVDRPQCGGSASGCLCIVEAESVWNIQTHIDVHGCVASTDAPDPVSAADAKLHSTVDTR